MMLDHATELNDNRSWPIPSDDVSPIPDPKSLTAPTIVSHPQLISDHRPASRPVSPNVPQLQPDRLPSLSPLPPEMVGNTDPEPPSVAQRPISTNTLLQAPANGTESLDRLTPLTSSAVDDEEHNSEARSGDENGEMATEIDEGYQSGGNSPDDEQETLSKVDAASEPTESPPVGPTVSEQSSQDIKVDNDSVSQAATASENAIDAESKSAETIATNQSSAAFSQPIASTSSAAASPASSPNPPPENGDRVAIPASPSSPPKRQVTELDPKVSVLLELNAEMIKIFADFQARNLQNSSECQAYQARLQSNLAWLASAVDRNRPEGSLIQAPLPNMETPPVAGLIDGARLKQLYEKLPVVFAKDVALRQRLMSLKRERTPDEVTSISRKRQDLGDSKISLLGVQQPLDQRAMLNGIRTTTNPTLAHHGAPTVSALPSPASQMHNPINNVQIAPVSRLGQANANADLQRQMQVRQLAQRQPQASPPAPQLRQGPGMSPLGPGNESTVHDNNTVSQHQHPQGMQAAPPMNPPSAPNPAQLAVMQVLQDPNHPWVKMLLNRDPSFLSKPFNYQMQTLQAVQQHNIRRMQQVQQAGRMGMGIQNPNLAQNPMMGGAQYRPPGTMPLQPNAAAMQNAMQQQQQPGGAENTMQYNPGINPAMIAQQSSRPGTSSGQFGLNGSNMTPQQRQQLMLMQQHQQQQMRNAGQMQASSPPGSTHSQTPLQQHSPPHPQSPAAFMDNADPTRPPSAVPGITRSTRSPSEPLGTPTKRNASFSNDTFHHAVLNSASQHSPPHGPMPGPPQSPFQQQQQNPNPAHHPQSVQQSMHGMQGQPGWPPPNYNAGMNPAVFQLSPGQGSPHPGAMPPQYVNPMSLGGGPQQHNPTMNPQHWPQNPAQFGSHASSPHPDVSSPSRHTSTTPAPAMAADSSTPSHYDSSMYSWAG